MERRVNKGESELGLGGKEEPGRVKIVEAETQISREEIGNGVKYSRELRKDYAPGTKC